MKTQRVVVTGAAGFIGSHLCEALVARGFDVIGFDDLSMGSMENFAGLKHHSRFHFKKRDIARAASFSDLRAPLAAVIHTASLKIPRYGNRKKTLLSNALGTQNCLKLAVRCQSKFIFTSTSDVYGNSQPLPFNEENPSVLGPSTVERWAYAASKLYCEHLAFGYAKDQGIPVAIARIFGTYGPREHRSWWGGPTAVFIEAVLDHRPIPIHGDGRQTRSFCYVTDTVNGIVAMMEKEAANGQIINIGNDEELTIQRLARLVLRLMKVKNGQMEFVRYDSFTGEEYQDVRKRRPDLTKAGKLLRYRPRVSLEEGLQKTIRWHRLLRG